MIFNKMIMIGIFAKSRNLKFISGSDSNYNWFIYQ